MDEFQDDNRKTGFKWAVWRVMVVLCVLVLVGSAGGLGFTLWNRAKEARTFDELAALSMETEADAGGAGDADAADGQETGVNGAEKAKTIVKNSPRAAKLHGMNEDCAAWLQIPDSPMDYPVMHTPEDQQYYIRRDFYGRNSVSGTPFMGDRCDVDSDSIIVYGHNMKNGTMFGSLDLYDDKAYWEEHPVIHFATLEEDREYEVVAAFRTRIYLDDEPGFRYYQYVGDLDEALFDEFMAQVNRVKIYDTGVDVAYGDKLLILSTCSYHTDEGRYVVVGRYREDTEQ